MMTDKHWRLLVLASVTAAAVLVFQWPVIFLMSLVCFGAFKAIDTFLWKFFELDRYDLEIRLPKWARIVLSPFLFCIYCAPSVWGSAAYWFAFLADIGPSGTIVEWLLFVVATAGLNTIIDVNVKI